jgi:hypothetical protein
MRGYYNILIERYISLVKNSGFTWAFAYGKEVLRLTTRALAGTPDFTPIFIKRDKYGLPTIIPGPIRIMLRDFCDAGTISSQVQRRVVIATLTILSVFRTFGVKVLPSLATIRAPFSGMFKTLPKDELTLALNSMSTMKGKLPKLSIKSFSPLVSQKAGPNGRFATWSAGIDAIAFIHEPRKAYLLIRWLYNQKAYYWIVLFLFLNLLFGLVYYILYKLNKVRKLELGKLGVVYNQAGKARVVAATNWWLQSAFAGLHESIFTLLRSITQDGTHDQEACFNKMLMRSDFRENLSGFDLSAATDRLPIEIQEDILNILGIPGTE